MTQTLDIRKMRSAIEQANEARKSQAIHQAVLDSRNRCFTCPSRTTFTSRDDGTASVFCGCLLKFVASNLTEYEAVTTSRPEWCPRTHKEVKQ